MATQQNSSNNTPQEPPILTLIKYTWEWIKSNVLLILAIPATLLFMSYYEAEYVGLVRRVAYKLNISTWGYPLVWIALGLLFVILIYRIKSRDKNMSNADPRTVYAAIFVTCVFVFTLSVVTPSVVPSENLPASIKVALWVCMILLWWLCFCLPFIYFLGNKRMNNQLEKKAEDQSQIIGYIDDEPVADSEEDVLGHKPYVQELIKRIRGIRLNHTGSIAITGSWGAGKTSFVKQLEEELKSDDYNDEFIFLTFEPMRCERPELIQSAFFDQLEAVLSEYRTGFARHFRLYKELIGAVDNKYLGLVTTLFSITQEDEFDRIQRAIQSLHRHVVVFIDDVDRLERDELVQIFRLVRFNAKFHNLVFLLAMDKTKVEATMGKDDNYSDKFAETEFYLPVQSPDTVWDYIVGKIGRKAFSDSDGKKNIHDKDFTIKPFVRHCLPTMRDAKRFVNSFLLRFNLVKQSEDHLFIDYFLISLLHYADPEAFDIIAQSESFEKIQNQQGLTIKREKFKGTKVETDDCLWGLVLALFPDNGIKRKVGDRCGINDNDFFLQYFNEVLQTSDFTAGKALSLLAMDFDEINEQINKWSSENPDFKNDLIEYFKNYPLDNLPSDDSRIGKYFIIRHILDITELDFVEDLAVVWKGDKWGFIDKDGAVKVSLVYDEAWAFAEGLAAVRKGDKWGFINKDGAERVQFNYGYVGSFSEGLSAVEKGGKYGFIDKTGAVKIPIRYDDADKFSEGLSAVKEGGKWGFIDKTGAVIVPIVYDIVGVFSGGLSAVWKGGKWGFIDKGGAVKVSFVYDRAMPFSEGLAAVRKGRKWGFVNKIGAVIIPFEYDDAWLFSKGFALVFKGGEEFYINKDGKRVEVICDEWYTIEVVDGKKYWVDMSGRWGVAIGSRWNEVDPPTK